MKLYGAVVVGLWMTEKRNEQAFAPVSLTEKSKQKYYRRRMFLWSLIGGIWIFIMIILIFYNTFLDLLTLLPAGGIMLLLLYVDYNTEKKYREIEGSFQNYISYNGPTLLAMVIIWIVVFIVVKSIRKWPLQGASLFIWANLLVIIFIIFLYKTNILYFYLVRRARPLNDGALVSKIRDLQRKMGIGYVELYILKGKKMKIANAIQIGSKRYAVFLYDYLLENLETDEILAVISHEFAHIKLRHTTKLQRMGIFQIFYYLNVATFFAYTLEHNNHSGMTLLFILLLFISIYIVSLVSLFILRRFEKEADLLGVSYLENKKSMITALEKLSELGYIPKKRHREFTQTHPSIHKRIEYINEYIKKHMK